jgi:molybdopterin-binding protein
MNISARNILKGIVKKVEHGVVTTEVTIELPGGAELVSTITKHAADNLQLAPGKAAYAIIKASNVMIGTD